MTAYLLGVDIGSSSVKATLLEAQSGSCAAAAMSPAREMPIDAARPGWAEQDPAMWWEHLRACAAQLKAAAPEAWAAVAAIGISYQMHGLVVVDRRQRVLRPAIIWCDSRAVGVGERMAEKIGPTRCLQTMLNLPGNLTASKLRWVRENEPELYARIDKIMLPGDYIAMKLTGEIATTPSGLSEMILWDFPREQSAEVMLDAYEIDRAVMPPSVATFSIQSRLLDSVADELGLPHGVVVAFRAGDQPNNALSLQVLAPGEIAATAGTSGVVYGVIDKPAYDAQCRVNTFVHVTHAPAAPRYGVLLCINGTGSLNRWLKHGMAADLSYDAMNARAAEAPVGAQGLVVLPFGNGAERVLENRDIGASMHGINFNVHSRAHVLRAAQEGIVFSLMHGIEVMREMGMEVSAVRAGSANMFLSPLFREAFATTTGVRLELFNTDGSQGAARGAGIGAGIYDSAAEAFAGLKSVETIEPNAALSAPYRDAYEKWAQVLRARISAD